LIVRINKKNELCDSCPCVSCLCMMKILGIKKIYYSTNDGTIVCKNINDIPLHISYGTRQSLKMLGNCECMFKYTNMLNNFM